MPMKRLLTRHAADRWIAGVLFALSLLPYTVTLAPSVVTIFDDSLEFQLVTYQLGIAHPTGYPLYTLLGKLFTFLPWGNVASRVNWMSAVFGAATVALLYLLILHAAPPRRASVAAPPGWANRLGAAFGALLLAVGQVFWLQATIAEVYTLNAFFVALLLLLALALPNSPRKLYALAFVAGLSLAHHRTTVLLLPALALYLLLTIPPAELFRPKTLALAALSGALPLLLYLYLPLRGHVGSLDGTYQNTWAGFWRQISAGGYGTFIFNNPLAQQRDAAFYGALLADQFYTIVPGLLGLLFLAWFGRRTILALTGAAFVTYFVFNVFYNVADIQVFFIPVFLVWAGWSGVGAAFLLRTAATFRRPRWRAPLVAGLLLIFGWMLAQLGATGLAAAQARNRWDAHDYGVDILRQPTEEGAAVVGILGEMTLLRYFQQTEGLRPDLQTIAADAEADRLAAVTAQLAQNRAVYLTRPLPGAPERWSLSALGPLIRVNPQPVTTPPPAEIALNRPMSPEMTLLGATISRAPHTGSGPAPVRLTLVWRAESAIPADLKISTRLLAPDGSAVAAEDAAPVHFAYPTSAWRPGEFVTDVIDLPLPPDLPPGPLTPLVILYNPAQNAAEVARAELPAVDVR